MSHDGLRVGKSVNLSNIEAPQGGVPPPNVFGVWSVAIREVVRRNKALRFEFSGRRSYGFCSRLCPRQVLGFSALSSASSWIFLAKLAEDLAEKNKNQIKIGGGLWGRSPPSKSSRKHAQSKPRSSEKSSKNHRKSSPDPPKNRGQEVLKRSSKAGSY